MKWLALGDSYTVGEDVATEDAWPAQVNRRVACEIAGAKVDVIAKTGWATRDLLRALDEAPPALDYDVVALLIGVNDQYRGRAVAAFREDLERLLQRAIACAGGRVERTLVIAIPDWSVTPFAASRDRAALATALDTLNRMVADAAKRFAMPWIDIVDLSRRAATDLTWLAPDGLHPSGAMYAAWAERIAPVIVRAVSPDLP